MAEHMIIPSRRKTNKKKDAVFSFSAATVEKNGQTAAANERRLAEMIPEGIKEEEKNKRKRKGGARGQP